MYIRVHWLYERTVLGNCFLQIYAPRTKLRITYRRSRWCDKYYTADSLITLFERVPENGLVKFLQDAGVFLSDFNVQTFYTILQLTHPPTNVII